MRGRCLCGAVVFEVAEATTPIGMCHCSKCRRVSGVASNADFMVATDKFEWRAGEQLVSRYSMPDGWGTAFCSTCGSPAPMLHPSGGAYWVPAGSMDEPSGLSVAGHIFVSSSAGWDEIAGDAPKFEAGFDSEESK
jgi:hypothetical protein